VRAATALSATRFTDEDRARFRETTALTLAVPEIRARALDEFTRTLDIFANALAKRTGRDPDDLAVRTMAGAIFGVIMGITLPVLESRPMEIEETFAKIDKGLALLEAGLPL
jgi:MftR C-terminal domain